MVKQYIYIDIYIHIYNILFKYIYIRIYVLLHMYPLYVYHICIIYMYRNICCNFVISIITIYLIIIYL